MKLRLFLIFAVCLGLLQACGGDSSDSPRESTNGPLALAYSDDDHVERQEDFDWIARSYTGSFVYHSFEDRRIALAFEVSGEQIGLGLQFLTNARYFIFEDSGVIDHWANNRHSDALETDAAEPIGEVALPDELITIVAFEYIDRVENARPGGSVDMYDRYSVAYYVDNYSDETLSFPSTYEEVAVYVYIESP